MLTVCSPTLFCAHFNEFTHMQLIIHFLYTPLGVSIWKCCKCFMKTICKVEPLGCVPNATYSNFSTLLSTRAHTGPKPIWNATLSNSTVCNRYSWEITELKLYLLSMFVKTGAIKTTLVLNTGDVCRILTV